MLLYCMSVHIWLPLQRTQVALQGQSESNKSCILWRKTSHQYNSVQYLCTQQADRRGWKTSERKIWLCVEQSPAASHRQAPNWTSCSVPAPLKEHSQGAQKGLYIFELIWLGDIIIFRQVATEWRHGVHRGVWANNLYLEKLFILTATELCASLIWHDTHRHPHPSEFCQWTDRESVGVSAPPGCIRLRWHWKC